MKMEQMSLKEGLFWIAIIALSISFILLKCGRDLEVEKDKREIKIDTIKNKAVKLNSELKEVDVKIDGTKTVINTIVKEKEVQVKYIDKLSDKELEQFYIDRYER